MLPTPGSGLRGNWMSKPCLGFPAVLGECRTNRKEMSDRRESPRGRLWYSWASKRTSCLLGLTSFLEGGRGRERGEGGKRGEGGPEGGKEGRRKGSNLPTVISCS